MLAFRTLGLLGVGALIVAVGCSDDGDSSSSNSNGSGAASSSGTSMSTNSSSASSGSGGGSALTCSEAYTDIPQGECDLLSQNCGPGTWCDVVASGTSTACVADSGGLKGKGEDCNDPAVCKAGLQCIDDKCTPVCCPASDQPCEGGSCDIQVNFGSGYAMVCSYSLACTLFAGDCPAGYDCHIGDANAGLAVCDQPSSSFVGEGEACMYRNDCGESQLCNTIAPDTGICRHLCDTATAPNALPGEGGCLPDRTCTAVNAAGFPGIGICML